MILRSLGGFNNYDPQNESSYYEHTDNYYNDSNNGDNINERPSVEDVRIDFRNELFVESDSLAAFNLYCISSNSNGDSQFDEQQHQRSDDGLIDINEYNVFLENGSTTAHCGGGTVNNARGGNVGNSGGGHTSGGGTGLSVNSNHTGKFILCSSQQLRFCRGEQWSPLWTALAASALTQSTIAELIAILNPEENSGLFLSPKYTFS